jgi:subtilisin-like proprotein convertase family protein
MKGRMRSAWFGACVGLIVALGLGLVGVHSPVAANGPPSFCNTASIAIPASGTGGPSGVANPYPSNITVSGLSDLVDTVTVTLNNLSHTFPADIDILLVGPEGQTLILMSDRGGGFDISNATLTFDDAAAASLPGNVPIVTGTFKPTDFFDFGEVGGNIFPAPAPAPSGATTLATFNGTDPNGTWSLYVVDDREFDVGSIAGGWCVTITTAPVLVFTFAGFFPPVDNPPPLTRSRPGAPFR